MTQIIDFRNAKYHGQTLQSLPHGLGIIIDYKNVFCLAEWDQGHIHGKCVIVFGDSKIFYGQIRNEMPVDICTYHLKDKCQVFCNFQRAKTERISDQRDKKIFKNNKLVALLPTFNMIISVQGQSEQHLQIVGEQVYKSDDLNSLKIILQKMLDWRFPRNQLQSFLSLQSFIRANFKQNPSYQNLLDILYTNSTQGGKQIFITMKTNLKKSSLGIRILNCMQNSKSLTNRHNDGNSYIVKALGYFTKEGTLQYGLKNIKTLIKGNVKEEAILNDEKSTIRYQDQQSRPKQCSINVLNLLKKSLNFENSYIPIRYLSLLQAECLNINFNIKQTEMKKFAQLILQNPKQLTMQQKQKIQEGRNRKINKGTIQKNVKDESPNPYKKNSEQYEKKNEQLQKVRQDIYRSVSKKKFNGTSSSPFVHAGTNLSSSPQKDVKPSELTNVKPILQIYKNTADKSFYNSINKNDVVHVDKNDPQGYKFALGKNAASKQQSPSPKRIKNDLNSKAQTSFKNSEYFKNLQDRKRLYKENDKQKSPPGYRKVTDYGQAGLKSTTKKKFSYLPEDQNGLHDHQYEKNINNRNPHYKKYEQPESYSEGLSRNRSEYINDHGSSYVEPQQSVYDPHLHYHDHFNPKKSDENYFKSRKKSPHLSKYLQSEEGQAGKLGKRVIKKTADNNYPTQSPNLSINKKPYSPYEPIVVPQFKINHTHVASEYKRPSRQQIPGITQKRQHHTRYPNQRQHTPSTRTPLQTQKYRKQYLQQTSPMKKMQLSRNTQQKYRYENEVIMDPAVNYAKQDLETKFPSRRENKYLQDQGGNAYINKEQDRSRSPMPRRKKILHDNPFQS